LTHDGRSAQSNCPLQEQGAAMDANSVSGKCLCGSIVFQYTGAPNWTLQCHCESCRRATSSPITTWISVPRSAFAFTKGAPRYFHSSPGVRRGFCENCGSPLTYENERIEAEIHIYAVSLLDTNYGSPSCHVFVNEQLPWFEALDDLRRFATTGRDGASPIRIGPKRRNWIDLSCRGPVRVGSRLDK
jgi:hypothetical protein